MIRIELRHIKKNGFFKLENYPNASYWRKGKRDACTKKTWVHFKEKYAARVNPNRKVYTKIEYIKPNIVIDVFNLEYV